MYTIVVVDDEEELRKTIIRRIDWEGTGFHVVGEASNGIEALEQVQAKEPDLLLTDIRMPFLSGLELARQVREVHPATHIAFMSGYDDFGYAREAIEYNIISYILKPLTMASLTQELIKIREKLDSFFEEFSEQHAEILDTQEFVIPLVLDGYMPQFLQGHGLPAGTVSGASGSTSALNPATQTPAALDPTAQAPAALDPTAQAPAAQNPTAQDPAARGGSREYALLKQAEACGLIKSARNPTAYVIMSSMLLDTDGRNITVREHVHPIESIVRKYTGSFHFYSGGKIVSLLIAPREALTEYIHIAADEIAQKTKRILEAEARIGISRIMNRLSDCHEAYKDSVEALRYMPEEPGNIRYSADELTVPGAEADLLMHMVSDLENYIRIGDRAVLAGYFASVSADLKEMNPSRTLIRLFMARLMSAGIQVLCTSGDPGAILRLGEKADLNRMASYNGSPSDAVCEAERFCLTVMDLISAKRETSSRSICEKALALIDRNYTDPDFSLLSLSAEVGVSPNYLSSVIKKNHNRNFTDFLTERRMDAAKNLLLSTDMKIREVAERCGYRDQHYFSYSFKKYTGSSPASMRQQNKK